jgi:hypothetical protein
MEKPKVMIREGIPPVIKKVERRLVARSKPYTPRKLYRLGHSKVIVYSALWCMSDAQQEQWIKEETEKVNPVLAAIREAIRDCYRND